MMKWKKVKLDKLIDEFSVREKDYEYSGKLEFLGVNNHTGIAISKNASEDKISEYKIIEKGCFAYNPYRINVGSIGLLNEDKIGLISPAYVVFKVKPKTIIPELLLTFLKSKEGLRQINLYARGTVRKALRFEDICRIEINILEYDNQILSFQYFKKVNIIFDALSKEISKQNNLLSLLRDSILSEAIRGNLVPQNPSDEPASELLKRIKAEKEKLIKEGKLKKEKELPPIKPDEIPFDIPKNWVWCRLRDLGICKTGTTPSTENNANFGDDIPFISPADIQIDGLNYNNRGLSFFGLDNGILIPKDSLLMVCIGGSIGKSFYNTIDVSCNQQINSLTPLKDIRVSFLQYFVQSQYFQYSIWSKASGGTTPIVNRSKWESILIPLPPLKEQLSIEVKLNGLFRFINIIRRNNKETNLYKELLNVQNIKHTIRPNSRYFRQSC